MTRKPTAIRNADDLAAARARANELAGCTNDRDAERELGDIADAIEVYKDTLRVQQNLSKGEEPKIGAELDRGASDRARINLNDPIEVRYWTQKWGISLEQLKCAVARAGTSVAAVAKQLGKLA